METKNFSGKKKERTNRVQFRRSPIKFGGFYIITAGLERVGKLFLLAPGKGGPRVCAERPPVELEELGPKHPVHVIHAEQRKVAEYYRYVHAHPMHAYASVRKYIAQTIDFVSVNRGREEEKKGGEYMEVGREKFVFPWIVLCLCMQERVDYFVCLYQQVCAKK